MALLFGKNKSKVCRHIRNVFEEGELDELSSIAKNATQLMKYDPRTGKDRISNVEVIYYNLDVIISIGYRVKSKQGIIFRKWANRILKECMKKRYVIDANKFIIPNLEDVKKIFEEARNTTGVLQLISNNMLDFLLANHRGLKILDDYVHQTMESNTRIDSTCI